MNDLEQYLLENPEYIEIIDGLINFEKEEGDVEAFDVEDSDNLASWRSSNVPIHGSRLYQLETKGVLERTYDSNSTTRYSVNDREQLRELLDEINDKYEDGKEIVHHNFPSEDSLDDDIFSNVVGFDDAKWLLKRSLTTDSITNILLVGPPGSAKTVFLLSIRKLEDAVFIPASDSTAAGFNEIMFNKKPKYVLMDEIDDMDPSDQESMSTYMENGIVKETKYQKTREMKINTKTFAAANETNPIADHILNRFTVLEFPEYTKEEYVEVCANVLPDEENTPHDNATQIAELLWDLRGTADVREAISVARLSRGDPEKVIGVLDKYSDDSKSLAEKFK